MPALSLPFPADAIRKSRRQKPGQEFRRGGSKRPFLPDSKKLAKLPGDAPDRGTSSRIAVFAPAGAEFETIADIAAAAVRQGSAGAQRIPFRQQGGEGGAEGAFFGILRGEEETGQAGMSRKLGHTLPKGGDATGRIESPELHQ